MNTKVSGIRPASARRPRPDYLRVVPDPVTTLAPIPCDVPWCTSDHYGDDPDDLIHTNDIENIGPIELFDEAHDGHLATILQLDGHVSEHLDLEGVDRLIAALQAHRVLLANGAAA